MHTHTCVQSPVLAVRNAKAQAGTTHRIACSTPITTPFPRESGKCEFNVEKRSTPRRLRREAWRPRGQESTTPIPPGVVQGRESGSR